MPRASRVILPGVPVHVVDRGNNRQACFYAPQDRAFYLFHLRRQLSQARCRLHAYCLMSNHVHLLLTPASADGCSRLMKYVAQLHTQYINRTYGRTGSLWEGRFRSSLVQSEDYLLACYRYIEQNPVRAALCAHPREHEWSSYRANAEGETDDWLSPHEEYQRLGPTGASRRLAYRDLFSLPAFDRTAEIREATEGSLPLGNEAFKRALACELGCRVVRRRPGPASRTSRSGSVPELVPGQTRISRSLPP